jgi:hypothetical protein
LWVGFSVDLLHHGGEFFEIGKTLLERVIRGRFFIRTDFHLPREAVHRGRRDFFFQGAGRGDEGLDLFLEMEEKRFLGRGPRRGFVIRSGAMEIFDGNPPRRRRVWIMGRLKRPGAGGELLGRIGGVEGEGHSQSGPFGRKIPVTVGACLVMIEAGVSALPAFHLNPQGVE